MVFILFSEDIDTDINTKYTITMGHTTEFECLHIEITTSLYPLEIVQSHMNPFYQTYKHTYKHTNTHILIETVSKDHSLSLLQTCAHLICNKD